MNQDTQVTESLSELRQEEPEMVTLYNGDVVEMSDCVVELYDNEFALQDDPSLIELHDGDYAIRDYHDIVRMHDGDWAHTDDVAYCNGYDEYYLTDDCSSWQGTWYSDEWLDENTFICECCDYRIDNDNYAEDGRCNECYEEENEEESGERNYGAYMVHPYSDKSINYRSPQGKGPLFYGIELEVEVRKDAVYSAQVRRAYEHFGFDYLILKHDGSIGDNGFEMVTRPDTMEIHKQKWEGFINGASDTLSSWCNGRCGMHVHISRAALSQLQLGKMLVWVNHPDNATVVKTIAGRTFEQMNRWCKREDGKKVSDGKKCGSDERYVALNISEKTAEVRIFRGTLKPSSFFKNLEFCEALVAFCAPTNHSIRDIESPQAFLQYVRDRSKTYPNLHEFLGRRGVYQWGKAVSNE